MTAENSAFDWNGKTLVLQILMLPRASKNEWCGWHGDRIRLRITAPPVDNQANQQCISFLAKSLKTAKSNVRIVRGLTSRQKTIEVDNPNLDCWQAILSLF